MNAAMPQITEQAFASAIAAHLLADGYVTIDRAGFHVFSRLLESLKLARRDQNETIVARFMDDPEFQRHVAARLASEAYRRLGGKKPTSTKYPRTPSRK